MSGFFIKFFGIRSCGRVVGGFEVCGDLKVSICFELGSVSFLGCELSICVIMNEMLVLGVLVRGILFLF